MATKRPETNYKVMQREPKHKEGGRKWPRQPATVYLAGRSFAPVSRFLGTASELKLYPC